MSLQLEKRTVSWDGRDYEICCSMAVLEALQERHGSMKAVFEASGPTVTLDLYWLMLNRARQKAGEEPVDREELAESCSYAMLEELGIFKLFLRAMDAGMARKQFQEDAGKN